MALRVLLWALLAGAPWITLGVRPEPEQQPLERFIVYTRLHFDMPYVSQFVDWYVSLGFDRIVAIQSDAALGNAYAPHPSGKLQILPASWDRGDTLLREFSQHILTGDYRDWVLMVDSDEFLVLSQPTIQAYMDSLRAGRPWREARRLTSVQFRWAIVHHDRPYCAPAMAAAILAAQPAQGTFLRQMARSDVIRDVFDSHRYALIRMYEYNHFEGVEQRMDLRRYRGSTAHSARAFVDSAVVHVATRSLANAVTKQLAHAHARAVRPANESSRLGALENRYNASTARLVRLMHELGAHTPPPPGADVAGRPVGLSTDDRAAQLQLFAAWLRAYGVKGGDAISGPTSLRRGDMAAWDCGYNQSDLNARLLRLLETSRVPREQPLCDAAHERRALQALLRKEGLSIDEFERFAARIAAAHAEVLSAVRRKPFAPLPAEIAAVLGEISSHPNAPKLRRVANATSNTTEWQLFVPTASAAAPSHGDAGGWPERNPAMCVPWDLPLIVRRLW